MIETITKSAVFQKDDILLSARELVPILRERSFEINEKRSVPADVIQLFADAGLMQLTRPARYGGAERRMDLVFNVARILAEGDGSAAWVYAVTNSHDHLVGLYPEEVQAAYWASAQPLCASSYQPQGKAVPVDGGYTLSGTWSFCSGIDHCGWIVVGSLVFGEGGSAPSLKLFMLPKAELEVVDDWHMMGLAGTGSKSVVADKLFVPNARILDNALVVAGDTPGKSVHDNPVYGASIWLLFGFSILAPATGIVRGAYEQMEAGFRERANSSDPMWPSRAQSVQAKLAETSVLLESCELLFQTALEESVTLVMQGQQVSNAIRTRNRRNQVYIARTCRQAMDLMMQLAGGRGLNNAQPIQRATRDLFAISAHPGGNWDAAMSSYGSVALGGEPTEMFC